jgi:hypothetical protein
LSRQNQPAKGVAVSLSDLEVEVFCNAQLLLAMFSLRNTFIVAEAGKEIVC